MLPKRQSLISSTITDRTEVRGQNSSLMFHWATQKKYVCKARSAPCKLFLANWSETLRKSRSYVNDEVKRIL